MARPFGGARPIECFANMSEFYKKVIDSYRVLGVEVGAPLEDVRKSYRQLIRLWHPDVSREPSQRAESQSRRINGALTTIKSLKPLDVEGAARYLRSSTAKRRWTSGTATKTKQEPRRPTGTTAPAHVRRHDPGHVGFASQFARRGRDIIGAIPIARDEALSGGYWQLKLLTCDACAGWGAALSSELRICSTCDGLGVQLGSKASYVHCRHCGGKGSDPTRLCSVCDGTGERVPFTVQCHVPPGTGDSLWGVLTGQGHPGIRGGDPGNLYLLISVI